MSKWNFVAMGQVGLTGWTREVAKPVARSIARRTGRPEAEILSLIGAAFLAIALIDFLREVDRSSPRRLVPSRSTSRRTAAGRGEVSNPAPRPPAEPGSASQRLP